MKLSLRSKTVILIILIAAALSVTAAVVSSRVMINMISNDFRTRANDLAHTVAASVDPALADKLRMSVMRTYNAAENRVGNDEWGTPEYEEYVARYADIAESGAFSRMLAALRRIQDVNDVESIYLACVDPATEAFIYLVDAAEEDACPTGSIDPIYDFNRGVLTDPTVGFPAYETDTEEYGWLVTAGAPVYTDSGKVAAYALVDISMENVRQQQREYVLSLAGLLAVLTIAVVLIAIVFVSFSIVRPIKQIAHAAAQYKSDDPSVSDKLFDEIRINKKDEVGVLFVSIKKMENDIKGHIADLIAVNRQLTQSRREVIEMNELANKDALTGVRNKLAYDEAASRLNAAIAHGETDFGIAMVDLNFLKMLNDTWGHERGNDALISICNIICGVFVHSPVFRIGGDEFVVILENNDFDKAEELIDQFRREIAVIGADESLEPWERVSAAIGWSKFDPKTDNSVDDVFRRADSEMYAEKKRMKSIREE